MGQHKADRQRKAPHLAVPEEILTQLAPDHLRISGLQPQQHSGVEGFHAVCSLPVLQQSHGGIGERGGVAPLCLQFHHQRRPALEEGQNILKQRDGFRRVLKRAVLQHFHAQILDVNLFAADPAQVAVVDHRQLPIRHQMNV